MKKVIALFLLLACSKLASAEPLVIPRFEVGPLMGFVGDFRYHAKSPAVGGRFTVNLNQRLAVEYQMAWIGGNSFHTADSSLQETGHVKFTFWTWKGGKLSLFAVAGPGFRQEKSTEIQGGTYDYVDHLGSVGVDYGGGMQITPRRWCAFRLDLSDFYAGTKFTEQENLRPGVPSYFPTGSPRFWNHIFGGTGALMFRF